MRVGVGQAESLETADAANRAITMAARALGDGPPGAALIFAHVDADHAALMGTFSDTYPSTPVIGCSTAGEFSSAGGFSEDSVVVVLLQSDDVFFACGVGQGASDDPDRAAADAVAEAIRGLAATPQLCLFFPDPRSNDMEAIIAALGNALPDGCPVLGGSAGRIGTSENAPAQLCGKGKVNDAVPILLIGGDVEFAFSVCNSWHPVGEQTLAEGVEGNTVHRIGGRKALEFYQHYLGPHAKPASEFPLAVHDPESEKIFLRVPVGYDSETGAITFGASVPDGATVQLSEATPQRILEETSRSTLEAVDAFPGTPALALLFSCNARKGILGTGVAQEPAILTTQLHHGAAAVGFYGFAEISPLSQAQQTAKLHHGTLVTLLLGDRSDPLPVSAYRRPAEMAISDSANILRRKLNRSEYYRRDLEQIRDVNAALLRTVSKEIEDARNDIARQKAELEVLHAALEEEQAKSESLLRNILPDEVAEELKTRGSVEPVYYPSATVLFTDFAGFTTRAAALSPSELVATLNMYFTAFDDIAKQYGVEKLKTIGDAYMCVGGVPHRNDTHIDDMINAGLAMQAFMARQEAENPDGAWQLRVGIHTGPLMAGVIGSAKFAYDVWGDTVNIAARLESAGEAGRVNVSEAVRTSAAAKFQFTARGKIAAKNVGDIEMFFVEAGS